MAAVEILSSAQSDPQPRKLRVGIFLDGPVQPRWVADAFARIAGSAFAEIVLVEAGDARPAPQPWPIGLYGRFDRWAFGGGSDVAEAVDFQSRFSALKNELQTPVALDVAFAIGDIDDTCLDGRARYGTWRFFFGEDLAQAEPVAGWREVIQGSPVTSSGLKIRLGDAEAQRLAYRSWSRTYPLSVARNRSQVLRKTADFPYRALQELHAGGPAWLKQCKTIENRGLTPISASLPGIRGLTPIFGNIARRGIEKALSVEQWFLAFRFRASRFGDGRSVSPDLKGYTRLMPPKDRYWADPFALEKDGRSYIFFEELPFKAGKAHISMLEVKPDGSASKPVRVLERDYHLSYPFLIEDGGKLYMIPETGQNGAVELWRCERFPDTWVREKVLLDGVRCVDATVYRGADRWWMFANFGTDGSSVFDDELHLFHSDSLLGEWRAHPRNPIKSDARASRPAGQLFQRNGALYRPAQICVPLYGSGLSINRVLRLTPHDYAERQVERVLPARGAGLLGIHTLNRSGDLTVVDAFVRRSRI